ncbi:hypothetical protein OF001_U480002 [Pseudomonas sp. OF001]|nr:hypothetical protein OF001_U480002 [Pseudomonas sp. OF001]
MRRTARQRFERVKRDENRLTLAGQTLRMPHPLEGFPSGQRDQTVNLTSSTSKVRILPPPPD